MQVAVVLSCWGDVAVATHYADWWMPSLSHTNLYILLHMYEDTCCMHIRTRSTYLPEVFEENLICDEFDNFRPFFRPVVRLFLLESLSSKIFIVGMSESGVLFFGAGILNNLLRNESVKCNNNTKCDTQSGFVFSMVVSIACGSGSWAGWLPLTAGATRREFKLWLY